MLYVVRCCSFHPTVRGGQLETLGWSPSVIGSSIISMLSKPTCFLPILWCCGSILLFKIGKENNEIFLLLTYSHETACQIVTQLLSKTRRPTVFFSHDTRFRTEPNRIFPAEPETHKYACFHSERFYLWLRLERDYYTYYQEASVFWYVRSLNSTVLNTD